MVNVAVLAMDDGDLARAKIALDRAQDLVFPKIQPYLLQSFVLATARLHELQHDTEGADEAYRDAIALGPLEPKAHMGLRCSWRAKARPRKRAQPWTRRCHSGHPTCVRNVARNSSGRWPQPCNLRRRRLGNVSRRSSS